MVGDRSLLKMLGDVVAHGSSTEASCTIADINRASKGNLMLRSVVLAMSGQRCR